LINHQIPQFISTYYKVTLESRSEWTALPLKIGPKGCPETSVTNYQSTLRNIAEERKPSCLESFKMRG